MIQKAKNIYNKIPGWLRNRYAITICAFGLLLIFFDKNNLFRLQKRKKVLHKLEQEEKFYQEELNELDVQIDALENNPEALERFAREEYRMKKDDEDIFIIVDDQRNPQ